jgi:hypothetical protein
MKSVRTSKNIGLLWRHKEGKKSYQPWTNKVKDRNDNLLTEYFEYVKRLLSALKVHGRVLDIRLTQIH